MNPFLRNASRGLPLAPPFGLALALAASMTLLPMTARAQIDAGSIVGDVTDSQGGVLPGATVVATQEGTGFSFTATTNAVPCSGQATAVFCQPNMWAPPCSNWNIFVSGSNSIQTPVQFVA